MGRVALGWLVLIVACGRIGFDQSRRGAMVDAGPTDASPGDAPSDGLVDAAAACSYLPDCMLGEITCCTATSNRCILESSGCSGTIVRCSVVNHAGCPAHFACCITPQRPEPTCYDELAGAPC